MSLKYICYKSLGSHRGYSHVEWVWVGGRTIIIAFHYITSVQEESINRE